MTGIVRKTIFPKLATRYSISPDLNNPQLVVGNELIAVTNADELISVPTGKRYQVSVTAAQEELIATVPAGKRWTIKALYLVNSTGTYQHNTLYYRDVSIAASSLVYETWTAGTQHKCEFYQPLVLEEGDSVRCNISSYTGAGTLNVDIFYIEEDKF